MKNLKSLCLAVVLTVAAVAAPVAVMAAPAGDYDAITAAVDWGDVVTAIGAIAALIAAVLVVKKGSKMLLGMIGR